MRVLLLPGLLCFLMLGCTSAVLPLCSEVASNSFPSERDAGHINRYILAAAETRSIEIIELSPFAAEFRGSSADVRWLQARYPHLVCAFDPVLEPLDREVFMTCVSNAPEWIGIIQSENPEHLMSSGTLYRETCAGRTS